LKGQYVQPHASVPTEAVIESLLRHKEYKGVKDGTVRTYKKHLNRFAKQFPTLPLETNIVMEYLGRFKGETGRHKRNQHDLLNILYKHASRSFGILENPLDNLERPIIYHKAIRTLSIEEAYIVDSVVNTITERAVWEMTFGHGWRQIEVRRITGGDVHSIRDGIIWCRGKERNEHTPLLPETQELLQQLAGTLSDEEPIIRSRRIRAGTTQPLGADGISQLIQGLFHRSGLDYKGHDLRRTFCTLVSEASGNENLAMRLARDKVDPLKDRYINVDPVKLRENLIKYSPLRLISPKRTAQAGEKPTQAGEFMVETGESRTPRPRKAAQNILQA